ncbi:nucleotide-binding universal stress UspA family protein [Streptomyces sp. SAI-144]|uniref:universal stress protein n=1 Tax=Streptomyces sp. SAI-144 TaxID=2940544 RepID=UPI0024736614|nr:universal stress protein [Streptomyces sp. SAI-144]MDH6437186.1 nucleotide-binding universal stress UspA family protein [Streptomyces sp. SAI-144]
MEQVIIASIDPSTLSRNAVDWAAHEARLRGLPLRVVPGPPHDVSDAKMVVCGLRPEDVADSRTAGPSLPADVEAAGRPLVFVQEDLYGGCRSEGVALGVDARDPAAAAIDFAFDSARIRGSRLHAVHAWSLPADAAELPFAIPEKDRAAWEDQEVQQLTDALRPWREKHPQVPVLEDVVLFAPAQALLHCSAGAALVVVGRRPDAEWGCVVRSLLREATCPVAVVPS